MIPLILAALAALGVAVAVSKRGPAASPAALPPMPSPALPRAAPRPRGSKRGRPPARSSPVNRAQELRRQRLAAALRILDGTDPARAAAVRGTMARAVAARRGRRPPAAGRPSTAAAPVVPDVVMRVLGDRDAREGDLEAALNAATQGGHAPQVRILEARLANVRRIIGVLEQSAEQARLGNAEAARGLLVQGRTLAVADGRSEVIATIDARLQDLSRQVSAVGPSAPIPRAAVPEPSGTSPVGDPATEEVVAIRNELARARDAQDLAALAALVPRIERVVPVLTSQGRTELAAELNRNLEILRGLGAGASVPQGGESLAGLALQVAANIARSPRRRYDRAALARFQSAAGIAADGMYGPQSRSALARAGVPAAQLPPPSLYW